jgi:hypothetical protein
MKEAAPLPWCVPEGGRLPSSAALTSSDIFSFKQTPAACASREECNIA